MWETSSVETGDEVVITFFPEISKASQTLPVKIIKHDVHILLVNSLSVMYVRKNGLTKSI